MTGTLHGTAVAIDGHAVLITGISGSGKSDLALRLIDRGALLVGDDAVNLSESDSLLMVAADERLQGQMEVRGIGIFEMDHVAQAPLRLIVELGSDGVRLPGSWLQRDIAGWSVPMLRLNGFAASAAIKIELALKSIVDEGLQPVRLPVAL